MEDHLSQIETLWSVVRRAHDRQPDKARRAQHELLERYGGAIRRYLRAALKNDAAADDVYQDFAVRFVRGDYHAAAPEKGRFRSFLKSILFRLVVDHYRAGKVRQAASLEAIYAEPQTPDLEKERNRAFNLVWRDEMLNRAWHALEAHERESGQPAHSVLRLRVQYPGWKSTELADELSKRLGRPVSTANLRVLLHRSRDKFAELLLDAVAQTLDSPGDDQLEEELVDLELLDYCRSALERRREN